MVAALVSFAAMAAVAYAQKVNVDSDPSAPFAAYRTYAWTAGTAASVSLTEQRIHAGVDGQLRAKGLTLVESDPNVYVASFVLTKAEPQIVANGFGPWWGVGGGFATATVQTYVQGTLIVDLYDASTKKMVWRGVATDTASDKPSKNAEKIEKALTKIFQKYPPPATTSR
jgi:hypothetical protein